MSIFVSDDNRVRDVLCRSPLTTEDVSRKVGLAYGEVKRALNRLVCSGLAVRVRSGVYRLPDVPR
jgi:predicted transcriptional regulator